jgi:hypothetical protein
MLTSYKDTKQEFFLGKYVQDLGIFMKQTPD